MSRTSCRKSLVALILRPSLNFRGFSRACHIACNRMHEMFRECQVALFAAFSLLCDHVSWILQALQALRGTKKRDFDVAENEKGPTVLPKQRKRKNEG